MDVDALRIELKNHGQEHLLQGWDTLTDELKKILYNDVRGIDIGEVNRFFEGCVEQLEGLEKVDDHLQPIPQDALGSVVRTDDRTLKEYDEEGKEIYRCSLKALLIKAKLVILGLVCKVHYLYPLLVSKDMRVLFEPNDRNCKCSVI